uniref:low-complexity tail membrane protein n=1 Tax=Trichocoleus desertorum TaxID=1481672 RepID=UPI0025B60FBF|nr:low-complexity tail membrane protein [Trichocoleus desertorum]
MRSFWSEPYLWVHAAGAAVLPILLELCLLGFAVGDPILPAGVEVGLVAVIGIAPLLWMQLFRPFNIFSLMVFALKLEKLTVDQRRILSLFKMQEGRVLAAVTPVFLVGVLWQLYRVAPVAASVAPFPATWRVAGLLLAAIAFLGCNLFLQVPVSVARVLLLSDAEFAATEPYPTEKIQRDFTAPGIQVNQILPPVVPETQSQGQAIAAGRLTTAMPLTEASPEPTTSDANTTEVNDI